MTTQFPVRYRIKISDLESVKLRRNPIDPNHEILPKRRNNIGPVIIQIPIAFIFEDAGRLQFQRGAVLEYNGVLGHGT